MSSSSTPLDTTSRSTAPRYSVSTTSLLGLARSVLHSDSARSERDPQDFFGEQTGSRVPFFSVGVVHPFRRRLVRSLSSRFPVECRASTGGVANENHLHDVTSRDHEPPRRQPTVILKARKTRWWSEGAAGILGGVCQVVMFNPYDRALYLSVLNQRPFLDKRNWSSSNGGWSDLHKGMWPNLLQRVISYGLYFPIEQMYTRMLLKPDGKGRVPNPTPDESVPLAGQPARRVGAAVGWTAAVIGCSTTAAVIGSFV